MSPVAPLPVEALYRGCDPDRFDFETTDQLDDLDEIIGQQRALAAVRFGIGMRSEGYNLYVLGPPGTGKLTAVRQYLEQQAANAPRPGDWCYVYNFEEPQRPCALTLPAGRGQAYCTDLARTIEDLRSAITSAFESDAYQQAVQRIEDELKSRQESAFEVLQRDAARHDLALVRTPGGFVFAPTHKGEMLSPEVIEHLGKSRRDEIERETAHLQERLQELMQSVMTWRRENREAVRKLDRQVVLDAIGMMTAELREAYADLPDVLRHLDALEQDVLEHAEQFRKQEETPLSQIISLQPDGDQNRRYKVNLLIDNGDGRVGAPVIFEDHPSYQNLVGRVEHVAHMGALSTDFTLIRAGALHRAAGGYLVIDALKLLIQPYAWDGLKRALRSGHVSIESLGQMLSLISTVGLEPEPIPVDIKVVLIGDRLLYYLLCAYDPDFSELFKVAADFEDRVERTESNTRLYARLIGTVARKENLRCFGRHAVARVIEHAARLADDAERLSTHMRSLADLLREAHYWAGEEGHEVVELADVQRAIDDQRWRAGRVRERLLEEMCRGTLLVDTAGEHVAQVNGLSVLQLGTSRFGLPSRITATARLGDGQVVDIEREVELGGAIHSKGVLILTAFLATRYAPDVPLSLRASLVFEQSYGMVEGDSASVAELCALLSALADAPILQSLAVTGSVNQHGVVQAIGSVNEKIEGFFDLCNARGLSGAHGVLIPAANVKHLMLRADVVDAVRAGRFRVYPIETIDDAAALLTGLEAGQQQADGSYPEASLNGRVAARLQILAELRRKLAAEREAADESADGLGCR